MHTGDSQLGEGPSFPADESYGSKSPEEDGKNENNGVAFVPAPDVRSEQTEERSEEAVRASELSYRRLFETARDGILILNADTGRITDVNPFLMELLSFSYSEMVGKTVGELSPFKDIESNKIMLHRLQKDGQVRYEDLPLETSDGRHIAVEFVSNVYEAGPEKVIQCNVRDITQRKQAETALARLGAIVEASAVSKAAYDITNRKTFEDKISQLNIQLEQRVAERTAELEIANEELKAFSYSVSHDLRAPLRHVLGFVKLLQKEMGASLSEKSLHYLTTISESANRMGNLIDDLLSFSRIGREELQKADIDLNQLFEETMGDFEAETKDRNIVWNLHPLPVVRGDRALLRLALVNLIANAVKFTQARAAPKIEMGCSANGGDETVIFVRDNGAGFDPKYAGKLFGVFQRLHSQAEFEGTGIGLANVRRIIQRHGGRTWAEGVVDGGATFYFSIPKQTEPK